MRVAYILNDTSANNGANKAFIPLLKGMMSKGVIPLIVVPNKNGLYEQFIADGIDTIALTYRPNSYTYTATLKDKILFLPRMIVRWIIGKKSVGKLKDILKDKAIDLVHTNTSTIDIGQRAAHEVGIPHVFHFREYASAIGHRYFPSRESFMNSIIKNGDYSICITNGVQQFVGLAGNDKSVVIYDGVTDKETSMPDSDNRSYLLFAGRIEYNKGLDIILNAYGACLKEIDKNQLPQLKVAGFIKPSPYYFNCLNIINRLGLADKIEILGERSDLKNLMTNAKALIIASRFEGFGLCMPEAMMCGCLCIGYDNTGTKEQFDNGEKLFDSPIGIRFHSVEELASIILDIAHNGIDKYDEYRENAFAAVNRLYTYSNNTDSVYRCYESILHK